MGKKQLDIIALNSLDAMPLSDIGACMEEHCSKHHVDCVNWPDVAPYEPLCSFAIAHSQNYLYIHFMNHGFDLLATYGNHLDPVASDSCVEFFYKHPDSDEYWNFEFNCIGTINASHRVTRSMATRLTPEQLASIKCSASCGSIPFPPQEGIHVWTLTIAIPLHLIGIDNAHWPAHVLGNFYKCAGKSLHPHYLSWAPIATPTPDFHQPQFFGILNLK